MNIEKNLILIKGKDSTENIEFCKYENKMYTVVFKGGRTYRYNYDNITWLSNPTELNIKNKAIYANNKPLVGILKALEFNNYIKVIYKNNFNKTYHRNQIIVEESCLTNKSTVNCFEYFKELSKNIGLIVDGHKSFLGKQYEKISYISSNSALSYYLNPTKELKSSVNKGTIIFPFGFNLSQKEATFKALTNQISIIEGPPGTGKTQTILNIIANLVVEGKTVAVVSNNNAATANVYEKLQKYDLDFFCATLGKKENKEQFINSQSAEYLNMLNWNLDVESKKKLVQELKLTQNALDNMLNKQNKLANLKQQLSELEIEEQHFIREYLSKHILNLNFKSIFKLKSDKIMNLIIDIKMIRNKSKELSTLYKLRNLLKYGIITFDFYKVQIDEIIDYLYSLYYRIRINEITLEIEALEKELEKYHFEAEMKKFSKNSMRLFKNYIALKYSKSKLRPQFTEEDLWKNFDKVIDEYPVVLSTTHSLRNCIKENYLFDYVIIDEASQVDLLTGGLALSCARNVVVVGDLKQLTNVVNSQDKIVSNEIFKKYNLKDAYSFSTNNLLLSITKLSDSIPKTLLKEHYRCHPMIISYCNKKFYNSELIILTNEADEDKPLALYKTKVGNHARGNINQREIDIIINEVLPGVKDSKSIGIIAPYKLQVKEVSNLVDDVIEVDTVHKYQGREKDVIILSTVANDINTFIDDSNLINVAVSRAVKKLIVVSSDFENHNSNLGDLIKYIKYNNLDIIESNTSSIFDLLYKSYSNKLVEILKKSKRISEFASENLMYGLIKEVLQEKEYNTLDIAIHVPLKMTIKDISKLTYEERKFTLNPWTHNDFIIFNKLDKMPVLVVEVDGYKFHVENEEQLVRDRVKDQILSKYDIPIIRFKTNGSGEKEKLIDKLSELLKES